MKRPVSCFALAATALLLAACATPRTAEQAPAHVALFVVNDFHGNIQASNPVPARLTPNGEAARPAGGAAYLASALKELRAQHPASLTIAAGDLIGAAPLASTLLDDEPTIEVFNRLGLTLSSVGNHEFDKGRTELERRIAGRCPASGCALPGFTGARYEYLAANVLDRSTGRPFLAPWAIREADGVRIGFIGVVLRSTRSKVAPAGVSTLEFVNEATAANEAAAALRAQGVRTIIVLAHQGADYTGPRADGLGPDGPCPDFSGDILKITRQLDPDLRVVLSAHTHRPYVCQVEGRLLTQADHYGAMLTEVELDIDRASGRLLTARATNHAVDQTRYAPDPTIAAFVREVEARAAGVAGEAVTTLPAPLTRQPAAGFADSALGNLIADAMRAAAPAAAPADLALMNSGGIRTDLPAAGAASGPVRVSHGDLAALQPFGNDLVSLTLSGAELERLLNEQRDEGAQAKRLLQVSAGFSYRWDARRPVGQRAFDLRLNGEPLDALRHYRVVTISFLADGGDGLSNFAAGHDREVLGSDNAALAAWLARPGLPAYRSEGRIRLGAP